MFLSSLATEYLYKEGRVRRRGRRGEGKGLEERLEKNMVARDLSRAIFLLS